MDELVEPREIWDARFSRRNQANISHNYEPWLERWLALVETSRDLPILDLGCGAGLDARYLGARGFRVVAADFARQALRIARQVAPEARAVQVDHGRGLPFAGGAFQIIVANLSLHYFRWQKTHSVVAGVRHCLKTGGFLCARLNSTGDHNHGAVGHPAVEANCFLVNGALKRFFDGPDLKRLFQSGWQVHGLEEQTVHCYTRPKAVWEVVVEKIDRSS